MIYAVIVRRKRKRFRIFPEAVNKLNGEDLSRGKITNDFQTCQCEELMPKVEYDSAMTTVDERKEGKPLTSG